MARPGFALRPAASLSGGITATLMICADGMNGTKRTVFTASANDITTPRESTSSSRTEACGSGVLCVWALLPPQAAQRASAARSAARLFIG
jgi:hypothetical protein